MRNAIRRVVTGHDAAGKAVVLADGGPPRVKVGELTGSVMSLLWVTQETPALTRADAGADLPKVGIPPPPGGSVFRIVDFQPAAHEGVDAELHARIWKDSGATCHTVAGAPPRHPYMHRTRSIDYAIVLDGEISMLLDEEEVHLKTGDVVVQQATNHAWVNRSSRACRMAFILLDAREPLAQVEGGQEADRGGIAPAPASS